MTDVEETYVLTPLGQLVEDCAGDQDKLNMIVVGVLELLTIRADEDSAYAIRSDDGRALFVVAVGDDAKAIEEALPDSVKDFNDPQEEKPELDFDTNVDPGDEQPDYEPAA